MYRKTNFPNTSSAKDSVQGGSGTSAAMLLARRRARRYLHISQPYAQSDAGGIDNADSVAPAAKQGPPAKMPKLAVKHTIASPMPAQAAPTVMQAPKDPMQAPKVPMPALAAPIMAHAAPMRASIHSRTFDHGLNAMNQFDRLDESRQNIFIFMHAQLCTVFERLSDESLYELCTTICSSIDKY